MIRKLWLSVLAWLYNYGHTYVVSEGAVAVIDSSDGNVVVTLLAEHAKNSDRYLYRNRAWTSGTKQYYNHDLVKLLTTSAADTIKHHPEYLL